MVGRRALDRTLQLQGPGHAPVDTLSKSFLSSSLFPGSTTVCSQTQFGCPNTFLDAPSRLAESSGQISVPFLAPSCLTESSGQCSVAFVTPSCLTESSGQFSIPFATPSRLIESSGQISAPLDTPSCLIESFGQCSVAFVTPSCLTESSGQISGHACLVRRISMEPPVRIHGFSHRAWPSLGARLFISDPGLLLGLCLMLSLTWQVPGFP